MTTRNLEWLRREMQILLNMQVGDVDQAYVTAGAASDDPWALIDGALNEAVEGELEEALQETSPDYFKMAESFTWAASTRTFTVPKEIRESGLLRIDDITSGQEPGRLVYVLARGGDIEPEISWYDRNTLQWGLNGPSEAKTLLFTYLPAPKEMREPSDVPELIPERFRRLLIWSAGIIIKAKVNESEPPPSQWVEQQILWRQRFHLALWKGRPRDPNRPAIRASGRDYGSTRT